MKVCLCSYNKEPIALLGCCNVNIHYKGQTTNAPLLVVKGSGPSLLGRNWLNVIRLDWASINVVTNHNALQSLCSKYAELFEEGLGTLKGFEARIHVDPKARRNSVEQG